jgi:oligopeptide transport system substrate-binding protein
MFMVQSRKILISLGLFILVLAGCSQGAKGEKVLRVALEKGMSTLNYQEMNSRDEMEQVSQIMEGLTRYNKDKVLSPAGAQSWELSEDEKTYTFKLRQETYWSNGELVTAKDYVFAWQNLALKKRATFFIDLLKNGKAVRDGTEDAASLGVRATDDYTLIVELNHPYSAFLDAVSTVTFSPLNQKSYEEIGADNFGTTKDKMVTNGAFVLTTYDPGSLIQLTKNVRYWDAANVQIEKVEVHIVPDLSTQSLMFNNGELDIIHVTADLVDVYADDENTVTSLEPRIVYMYLSGETKTPSVLLKNKNFRQAIAHAVDKETITDNLLRDGSRPLNALIPNEFGNVHGETFRKYAGTHNTPTFDTNEAQSYLAKAKEELPEGTPLLLRLHVQNTPTFTTIFENVKAQIEQNLPGVAVELEMIPAQLYVQQAIEKVEPAGVGSWSAAYIDYYNFAELFLTDGTFNYGNYKNEQYDKLVKEALAEGDVAAQAKLYVNAENILMDDAVYLPLYQVGVKYRLQPNVKGFVINQSAPSIDYKFMTLDA